MINIINKLFTSSPLESTASEILNETVKNDLTTILSYNLSINLITVYFLFALTYAFTTQFV